MTEIKICGITNLDDAQAAATHGADALGFIFYNKSPRLITPSLARKIIQTLPGHVAKVGVFVNTEYKQVKATIKFCGLDYVQFHGDESPLYCKHFSPSLIIKAMSLQSLEDVDKANAYKVRAILVDTYDPQRYGGTGKPSNWPLAALIAKSNPLILSGGLNAENIKGALETVKPDAVDINSGAERSVGKKDHERIKTIIEIVRHHDRIRGTSSNLKRLFSPQWT